MVLNVSIVNSTISGNSAGTSGGGIYNLRTSLHVANSTMNGNSAASGGGIYYDAPGNVRDLQHNPECRCVRRKHLQQTAAPSLRIGYNLSSDDGGGYAVTVFQRFRQGRRGEKDFRRRSPLVCACAEIVLRVSLALRRKDPRDRRVHYARLSSLE